MWVTSSSATSCGAKSLKPKCLCNIMLLKRDCKLFPPEKKNVPVLLATGLSCSFQHYYIEAIPVSTSTDLQTANMLHVRLWLTGSKCAAPLHFLDELVKTIISFNVLKAWSTVTACSEHCRKVRSVKFHCHIGLEGPGLHFLCPSNPRVL